MLTRKTQYAWMALGGLICLFGLVLACKLRDGNKAIAQPEKLELPIILTSHEDKELASPPPPLQTMGSAKSLSTKSETIKDPSQEKCSEPKATLHMPFPAEPPPSLPKPGSVKLSSPPPVTDRGLPPLGPPSISTPSILPAAFGPDTPPSTSDQKPNHATGEATTPSKPSLTPTDPLVSAPAKATTPVQKAKNPEKKSVSSQPSSWNTPLSAPPSASDRNDRDSVKTQPGEPPLAPAPGPVQLYHVHIRETLQDIARRTLGNSERWGDLHKLNPTIQPDTLLTSGTTVRLPADACVQADDAEPVKPLPALRPKPAAPKAKVLPLTGTYQCSLDEKSQLTLPRALRDQLGGSDTVLLSPGPDRCLWLTNQPHLERLGERLDQSQANEADVRVFKRLYFAQTEKLSVNGDGRVVVPERLREFAALHQEVVLVGIDDHFEVWDAARWRSYTQQKSVGRYGTTTEPE